MTIADTAAAGPPRAPLVPPMTNGAAPTPSPATPETDPPKRRTIRRYSHDFVEKARRMVEETEMPLVAIAAELGISQGTLRNWMLKYDWTRPDGAPPLQGPRRRHGGADQRAQFVSRLHRTFARQLTALEKRTKEGGGESIEKDARTLGVLAKTLETLTQLDRDDGAKVKEPEPRDRDVEELDSALAERIAAWARSGEDN